MKPSIDKSSETFEVFVRKIFAERHVFGRADIEQWLEDQRKHLAQTIDPKPWQSEGFERFMDAKWDNGGFDNSSKKAAMLLTRYVTAGDRRVESSDSRFNSVLRVGSLGCETYFRNLARLRGEPFAIIIVGPEAYAYFDYNDPMGYAVAKVETATVSHVLILMMEEVKFERSKATQALEFLLSEYRDAIFSVRESAKNEFYRDGATSAD